MKKTMLFIIILCSLMCGCEPAEYDINSKSTTWNMYYEGTITSKSFVQNPDDANKKVISITFKDGSSVLMGHLHEAEKMKVGQTGSLYKWPGTDSSDSKDINGYFIWKINSQPEEASIITEETKIVPEKTDGENISTINTSTPPVSQDASKWISANAFSPSVGTTVLILMDDGIISTGYMDDRGDWRLEYYRNKLYRDKVHGGQVLTNVTHWKSLPQ